MMLKGRCRHCSAKLSYRYPLFELLTGLSFILAFNKFGMSYQCLIAMILTSVLIVISFIDIDTMIIYDRFHFMILALGLIQIQINHTTIESSLIGMVIISIPYLILAITTQSIGGGDVKLTASSGFLLNPKNTVLAFILSTLIGGIYGILLIVFKNAKHQDAIPFGPFLCIGIFTAFLYGDWIITAYFSLF